ncbi:hypothetical protein EIP86_011219 [Pleurotus ostreatoroseus]|nr:hypothetical protein EIP86_011219 [Pleurotus ostreatoroseus]
MEFLSQDRELGLDLVNLLTEKLKTTRETVERLEKENQTLRDKLQIKQEQGLNEIPPEVICKSGICSHVAQSQSIDEVKALSKQLDALKREKEREAEAFRTNLRALEMQKEVQARELQTSLHAATNEKEEEAQLLQAKLRVVEAQKAKEAREYQDRLRAVETREKKIIQELQDNVRAMEIQKEQAAQQSRNEISHLQAQLDRTGTKYDDCRVKLKEYYRELETLRDNQRRQEENERKLSEVSQPIA